ncbi:MAG TPA: hypothetical protein PL105_24115, partial [Caldilineaceae bacterium]|nr:hypothetical protein [Caldilineaceae bacterium]
MEILRLNRIVGRLAVQMLLILALLPMPVARLAAEENVAGAAEPLGIAAPVVSVGASASPSFLAAGGLVTYRITGVNSGDSSASNFRVAFTLPSGFVYRSGSSQLSINDALISSANPSISGRTLT